MDDKSCVIYSGEKFTLEWYYDKNGKSVAFDYFLGITKEQRRKFLVLIKRMGDMGKIIWKGKQEEENNGNDI